MTQQDKTPSPPAGDIGLACPTAPERIWLQVDPEPEDREHPVCPADPHSGDITWCADKINETDTLYIRADLARGPSPSTAPVGQPLTDERIEAVVRSMGFTSLDPYKFARAIAAECAPAAPAQPDYRTMWLGLASFLEMHWQGAGVTPTLDWAIAKIHDWHLQIDEQAEEIEALKAAAPVAEPAWFEVDSKEAPIIRKAIKSAEVAEEYAQKCRDNGYRGVEVHPLYRADPSHVPTPGIAPK